MVAAWSNCFSSPSGEERIETVGSIGLIRDTCLVSPHLRVRSGLKPYLRRFWLKISRFSSPSGEERIETIRVGPCGWKKNGFSSPSGEERIETPFGQGFELANLSFSSPSGEERIETKGYPNRFGLKEFLLTFG